MCLKTSPLSVGSKFVCRIDSDSQALIIDKHLSEVFTIVCVGVCVRATNSNTDSLLNLTAELLKRAENEKGGIYLAFTAVINIP